MPPSTPLHEGLPSCDLDHIDAAIDIGSDGSATGRFKHLTARSAFQPILSLAHRRPVGYEGLLRAHAPDGSPVPPLDAFRLAENEVETTFLDRLCRAVHLRNFIALPDDTSWLFININPKVVVDGRLHGSFFSELLQRHGFPAHRVVVEIVEEAIRDEALLADAVSYYKELGCLVAIDDFGAGHSNFDRIWRIEPHIVKFDRSVSVQAAANPRVRRVLPNLVNLIHEAGSLALMEGIETETEALIAMDADVDFAQGYFFARPAETSLDEAHCHALFGGLCDKFKHFVNDEAQEHRQRLASYLSGFRQAAGFLESGLALEEACGQLLKQPRVQCCYLLGEEGRQVGANLDSTNLTSHLDLRFIPLADAHGANWARRQYFRQAMNHPGRMQVSNPYLSIATSKMCVTLSVTVPAGNTLQVLCCDLDWS
jgi:EAL domain-containing protein (putative c-di-GMP-specific phosphodiesterase class I)